MHHLWDFVLAHVVECHHGQEHGEHDVSARLHVCLVDREGCEGDGAEAEGDDDVVQRV